ncbi:molybdopterin molybdotransferase MoeA [Aeoliella mucimassa]|uniref:Molybdopterin molybdenumtransferase n=1 Tax=Aeoliella mucimassa TaxID=2527972 RepID=A0A518AHK4_9BACT|nr:gephyrin-like molybdotransferase Glp [Aeoliella mucimassa]QDU54175.1 Molybdopterin molybdenumtransferase [Aeoliella mucimassa]
MISFEQALEHVAEQVATLATQRVRLRDSMGLVLGDDVTSDVDSPPYNKSLMDGYAVAAGDTSAERKIVERIMAGDVPRYAIRPGIVTQVMTGAPVPDGTAAVVPVERTSELPDDQLHLDWVDPAVGTNVQPQGSLSRKGQTVVTAGTRVAPHVMGALAEAGAAVVQVVPRPTVAILVTGNELVSVDERPDPGQIRDANGPMLRTAVSECDATPYLLPRSMDDLDELTRLVAAGLEADVLLVSGGMSVGVKDLMPQAFAEAGVERVFHRVSIKPGRPLWFGIAPRQSERPRLVFGLPGNPVSGLACFHLFVRPTLEVLAGRSSRFELPWQRGRLTQPLSSGPGREGFRPAVLACSGEVTPCNWQGSADLAGMVAANCLLRVPGAGAAFSAGDWVDLLPLGGSRGQ